MDLRFVRVGFLVISGLLGSQVIGVQAEWPMWLRLLIGTGAGGILVGRRRSTSSAGAQEWKRRDRSLAEAWYLRGVELGPQRRRVGDRGGLG